MDPACSLMRMNPLLRRAVGLIKGLQIRQGGGQFELAVLSGILWFKASMATGAGKGGPAPLPTPCPVQHPVLQQGAAGRRAGGVPRQAPWSQLRWPSAAH